MRKLSDYQPYMSALLRLLVESLEFKAHDALSDVFRNPRLVVAFNHSTPISWIPSICYLNEKVCEVDGGDRIPYGIVDRFFYAIPGLKLVAEHLTQSDHPLSFAELLEKFTTQERTDLIVFPEGAMTFFGDLSRIQPFRSPKFVELSIRARAPILLCVHRGTEDWNSQVPIPKDIVPYISRVSSFFGRHMDKQPFINLPINLRRLQRLTMATKLYQPGLYESDLSGQGGERQEQIQAESEKIRGLMQEMYDELGVQEVKQARQSHKRKRNLASP